MPSRGAAGFVGVDTTGGLVQPVRGQRVYLSAVVAMNPANQMQQLSRHQTLLNPRVVGCAHTSMDSGTFGAFLARFWCMVESVSPRARLLPRGALPHVVITDNDRAIITGVLRSTSAFRR